MSRKNVLVHRLAEAQSLAANFNSPVTLIKYLDNMSYQINVDTSNSEGSFKVQGSLDYTVGPAGEVIDSGSWVDLDIGGSPLVEAQNDTILIDMNQLPFVAIRLVYTSDTAGTGTCDIWIVGKQLGG
jgi:hypothetical protein